MLKQNTKYIIYCIINYLIVWPSCNFHTLLLLNTLLFSIATIQICTYLNDSRQQLYYVQYLLSMGSIWVTSGRLCLESSPSFSHVASFVRIFVLCIVQYFSRWTWSVFVARFRCVFNLRTTESSLIDEQAENRGKQCIDVSFTRSRMQ